MRIYGVIIEGGKVFNIIFDYVVVRFFICVVMRKRCVEVIEKVRNIVEGVVLVIGVKVKIY